SLGDPKPDRGLAVRLPPPTGSLHTEAELGWVALLACAATPARPPGGTSQLLMGTDGAASRANAPVCILLRSERVHLPRLEELHQPLVLQLHQVSSSMKRINIRKAEGPDKVSGRTLKLCDRPTGRKFFWTFSTCPCSLLQFLSASKPPSLCLCLIHRPVPYAVTCLNDYRPVVLTPVIMKCFERIVLKHIKDIRENRLTEDAVSIALHTALTHLQLPNTYVRMLFVDFSSAFNTVIPDKLVLKRATTESILCLSAAVWYGSWTAQDRKGLSPGGENSTGDCGKDSIYTGRMQKKARRHVATDPTHPGNGLFVPLPSGKRLSMTSGADMSAFMKAASVPEPVNHEVCQELRGESSTFQLPEEEESLLSLLYQVSCVHGPGQVRCDVDAQELDIVDTLNCFPVDEERSVLCPPGPPIVHCDLLVGLIIVRYEAHYGGVVCKLYNGVCGVDGRTVTGEESEEGWAEHAALWCACAQDQCRGCVVLDSYHFSTSLSGITVLKAELKSTNNILTDDDDGRNDEEDGGDAVNPDYNEADDYDGDDGRVERDNNEGGDDDDDDGGDDDETEKDSGINKSHCSDDEEEDEDEKAHRQREN
ncbi:hypothetical protein L3Q82_020003, partial [Scortum barcoo]